MKHLTVVVALTLCTPLTSAAGPLQEDLTARRGKLMERLGPDTLAIFWSAPTRVYSGDVDYEYRQESNLLYLTGIDQPETILVLMPGNARRREILFIREADARREHWEGHSLTPAEATAQSGIQTVMTTDQFDSFVAAMLSRRAMDDVAGEYERFFAALADGRARLSMLLEPQVSVTAPPGPTRQFGANLKERFFGFAVLDATTLVWELRQVKRTIDDIERFLSGKK
jgi:Xaa-Pro aminopeptidase